MLDEHSEKPAEVYSRMQRLFAGPYFEMFGRKPRPNFGMWGNEISRADFIRMMSGSDEVPKAEITLGEPNQRSVAGLGFRPTRPAEAVSAHPPPKAGGLAACSPMCPGDGWPSARRDRLAPQPFRQRLERLEQPVQGIRLPRPPVYIALEQRFGVKADVTQLVERRA